ncbi:proteinase-activated receptor 2-like [Protopterus annectens]|uniref:proteinase-activated receptor 2-like n=1 Tax=Protopterus annectens TaxID=7888 RepID=UPI001CFBD1A6|nr:proteinase-activated receptor 2-like [Protopterus annectens]
MDYIWFVLIFALVIGFQPLIGAASSPTINILKSFTNVTKGQSAFLLVNVLYPETFYILSWHFEGNGQEIVSLKSGSRPQYSEAYQQRVWLFQENGTLRMDSTELSDAGRYRVRLYDGSTTNISSVVQLRVSKQGRSFIGREDESANVSGKTSYVVDEFAIIVLTSGLTTIFLPLIYIVVFIIGLPANAMALWVFCFRTKTKHPAVIYMACLALADLLFALWLPLKIAYHINGNNWIYGENLCKVFVGFFFGNMYCSILFITCLSVQRYWVVVNPMSQTRKNSNIALGVSAAVWVVVALSTVPLYLIDQTVYVSNLNITTCHDVLSHTTLVKDMFVYFLSLAIGVFFFPAVLTVFVYTALVKTLSASLTEQNIGKKRKRAIHLIIVVLLIYVICFTPSNVVLVVHYTLIHFRSNNNVYALYITVLCLSSINSCIDPFVYYFVSEDFRNHVKNTFLCRSVRTVESMQASYKSFKYSRKFNSTKSSSQQTSQTSC